MWLVGLTFLASAASGAAAGLWRLGVWWRFALASIGTLGLWAWVAVLLLAN